MSNSLPSFISYNKENRTYSIFPIKNSQMGVQGINVVLNDDRMSAFYSFNIMVVAGPAVTPSQFEFPASPITTT
jgi:hypothetical protein